jgi:hypothetical protein
MKNGDWVRLLSDETGVMEGPSEEHGAGAFRDWPAGSIGEVVDFNETTGYVTVIIPHDFGGSHSPFHTRVIVSANDVEEVERPRLQDIVLPDPPPGL